MNWLSSGKTLGKNRTGRRSIFSGTMAVVLTPLVLVLLAFNPFEVAEREEEIS